MTSPTSKVPVFLKGGISWREEPDGNGGGPEMLSSSSATLLIRVKIKRFFWCEVNTKVGSDDRKFYQRRRCCKTVLFCTSWVASHPAGYRGSFIGTIGGRRWWRGQEEFSFQADEREQGEVVPASLVGVLCKSVGVLLAEVHAGGAGAPSQAPAEEEAAASLTGAGCGHLSDGGQTWLPGHEPVQSVPGDMLGGYPGGCGGRSSG